MSFKKKAWVAIFSSALVACGGGGGSTSTTTVGGSNVRGLEMASTMSVIAANESTTRSATRGASSTRAYNDSWTDYTNDPVNTYVYDESMESLSTVNDILCMIGQTKAADMVNQGNYVALVDPGLCEKGENQSASGTTGGSSGRQTEYERWVVNASRESAEAPQIVKIWVPQNEEGRGPSTIFGRFTVTEAVTDANRFGKFVGNFEQVAPDGSVQMRGTLKTVDAINGKVAFTFFASDPSGTQFREATSVVMDPDGSAGVGESLRYMADDGSGSAFSQVYALAFNTGHVLRQDANDETGIQFGVGGQGTCLSRTSFDTNVWRYGLYRSNSGARVDVYSGFPIQYNNNGTPVNGHIGYWGLWLEDQTLDLPNGATVTKMEYGNTNPPSYTVVKAPGKLIKSTKKTQSLTSLNNETFNYWGNNNTVFGQWLVRLSGTTFWITHEITGYDQNGPVLNDVTDQDVTPTTGNVLNLHSESLGGRADFRGGDNFLTYYIEEFVQPTDTLFANSDSPVSLRCFQRCLRSNISASQLTDWNGTNSPYLDDATLVASPHNVYISRSDMTLKDGSGNPIALQSGVDPYNTQYSWGMQSGNMVTSGVSLTTPSDVWSQDVSYRWETGNNNWNQFMAVKSVATGAYESFDRPIQFAYTHTTANDANGDSTYNGKTYRLNYGGYGQLWGIPWVDDGTGRYNASFALKDGALLGPNGNEYVVKALDQEQRLVEEPGACSALVVNRPAAPLPTSIDGTPDIGAMPVLTTAPAVIAGELQ